MQIYVHRNNQQTGPFSEAELQVLINTGAVSFQDPVWWQGQTTWVPLGQTSIASKFTPGAAVAGTPPIPGLNLGVAKTSNLAIWSLVCGVGSLLCGLAFIPAIILGHLGLSEIKKTPGLQGRGMAMAGLIIGYAVFALLLVSIVAIMVLAALGDQVKGTFKDIDTQLKAAQAQQENSKDSDDTTNTAPTTPADSTTNTPPAITP